MANSLTANSALAQFNSLSQLNIVRQFGFMLILAASIALGIATVLWSQNAGDTVLYTGLTSQDSSDVVAALEQASVNFTIDNNTGQILVPSDRVREIRMQMANQGLPRTNSRGFDILEDDQSLGTSNFIEQARYQRALEQELVQTIKQIQGVRDARVHLSVPKQTSFIRNSRKPSASVMIDIASVQQPGDAQLSGIVHLVASSVAGMEAGSVSIVDQRGNLLSNRNNSELGSSSETIRFTRSIEEEYNNRIIDILTPIVGAGNVRAEVSANVDFTAMETTEESYNPDNSVVRSEQIQEELGAGSANTTAAGATPGTLAATPPDGLGGTQQAVEEVQALADGGRQSRVSSTRNFEIDRSVSRIRTVPGAIQQLSVAVLVDLQAGLAGVDDDTDTAALDPVAEAARIERLTQLVRDAIGFNAGRGDSVSVISERFLAEQPMEDISIPLWEQAWFASLLKQLGAALVVILLIFGVLRPALKSVVTNPGGARRTAALPASGTDELSDDTVQLSGNTGVQQIAAAPPAARSEYDQNLTRAQQMVLQEPTRAARMIQNWLANE